jgi:hypothetical protein
MPEELAHQPFIRPLPLHKPIAYVSSCLVKRPLMDGILKKKGKS